VSWLDDLLEFESYCDEPHPRRRDVKCDRNAHDNSVPHRNSETGIEWWLPGDMPLLIGWIGAVLFWVGVNQLVDLLPNRLQANVAIVATT
jgi:hypothetical protein